MRWTRDSHQEIIIPLMERRLLNLHVLHCAVIPLWDGIMMKILFRYSLIISLAQLTDRLGLSVLTRMGEGEGGGVLSVPFLFSIIGQLQYL